MIDPQPLDPPVTDMSFSGVSHGTTHPAITCLERERESRHGHIGHIGKEVAVVAGTTYVARCLDRLVFKRVSKAQPTD